MSIRENTIKRLNFNENIKLTDKQLFNIYMDDHLFYYNFSVGRPIRVRIINGEFISCPILTKCPTLPEQNSSLKSGCAHTILENQILFDDPNNVNRHCIEYILEILDKYKYYYLDKWRFIRGSRFTR